MVRIKDCLNQWGHVIARQFFIIDLCINKLIAEVAKQKQEYEYQAEAVEIPCLFSPLMKASKSAIQNKDHWKKNDRDKNLVYDLKYGSCVHHGIAPPCLYYLCT